MDSKFSNKIFTRIPIRNVAKFTMHGTLTKEKLSTALCLSNSQPSITHVGFRQSPRNLRNWGSLSGDKKVLRETFCGNLDVQFIFRAREL
jgi:hypothetical protein